MAASRAHQTILLYHKGGDDSRCTCQAQGPLKEVVLQGQPVGDLQGCLAVHLACCQGGYQCSCRGSYQGHLVHFKVLLQVLDHPCAFMESI